MMIQQSKPPYNNHMNAQKYPIVHSTFNIKNIYIQKAQQTEDTSSYIQVCGQNILNTKSPPHLHTWLY